MRLTPRQQQILDVLRDNVGEFEHPPTLEKLCGLLGLRSRGSLHKHIQALIRAGFVEPMAGQHRGIRLIADEPAAWTELAAQIDPTGLQQIRSLARQARAEQANARPPAAARQLFRRLREALDKPAI